MLMKGKIMFDRFYCIDSTKPLLAHFISLAYNKPYHNCLQVYGLINIRVLDSGRGQVFMI